MGQTGNEVRRFLSAGGRLLSGAGNDNPPPRASDFGRTPSWALAVGAAVALLYLSLAAHLPVAILANASHDDGWFYQHAHSMVAGHWMGRYSQMTLIKGPGYVVFLAANALLGTPVTWLQALLYLAACGLFAMTLRRLCRSTALGLVLFLAILWQPDLFPTRLVRDDIYPAQTLLYLACLVQALFVGRTSRAQLAWAGGAGLAFAWFWLTREEGVWAAPATLVLCVVAIWRERGRWRPVAGMTGVGAATLAILATCNFAAYRTFTLVDFRGAPFNQAVAALQDVRVGEPTPYVPVPARVRERLYAESPAFASLRPYFDGTGQYWSEPGCQVYPSTCGDFAGGWFTWALRDAVARAGHYGSPAEAERFYRALTAQVRAGCAAGRLRCAHGMVALMPGVTDGQWRQGPGALRGLADILLYRSPPPPIASSEGEPEEVDAMWRFAGLPPRVLTASEQTRALIGWFYAPPGVWLQLRCSGPNAGVIAVARAPSPDIAAHFNDLSAAADRFRVALPAGGDCRLQIAGASPDAAGVTFEQLLAKRDHPLAGRPLYIDNFGATATDPGQAAALRVRDILARAFGMLAPVLCVAAAFAYLAHLVRLARGVLGPDPFWWTCHALWLLVICRLAILTLVDLSSFPAVSALYLSSAFPLFWAALLCTLVLPLRRRSGRVPLMPS